MYKNDCSVRMEKPECCAIRKGVEDCRSIQRGCVMNASDPEAAGLSRARAAKHRRRCFHQLLRDQGHKTVPQLEELCRADLLSDGCSRVRVNNTDDKKRPKRVQ